MKKEEKEFELPRSLYKEIKAMNRDQMHKVISDIYEKGAKSVESGAVDVACLRTEIGKINGIGEKRLDEIMELIESFLSAEQEYK